jgi:hypothetical protein
MEQRRAPLGVGGVPVAKHRHEWGARLRRVGGGQRLRLRLIVVFSESTSVAVLIALVHELRVPNLGHELRVQGSH